MSESILELTVCNPSEADEAQLVALLSRAFRRWPQLEMRVPAIEHLRWKMRSDPAAARHHWVGEIDGRLVVMLLRIIRRVRVTNVLDHKAYIERHGEDMPEIQDWNGKG